MKTRIKAKSGRYYYPTWVGKDLGFNTQPETIRYHNNSTLLSLTTKGLIMKRVAIVK
jgi:hypothetical protein